MKQSVTIIIAVLTYYSGLPRLFYHLNRKAKRIITFHNVMPFSTLPSGKSIGLTDTEETFRMKVKIIRSLFKVNTDVFDPCSAVITFDDGYKNQSEIAGRILGEEGNIPAIIFASGRNIDNEIPSNALVVDLLLHWTHLAPNGSYHLLQNTFKMEDDNREFIWQKYIWPTFSEDSASMGRNVLEELNSQYGINDVLSACDPEYLRLRLTGITKSDITALHQKGWLVGWHTWNHYPLSKLDSAQQKNEIACSPTYMKSVVLSYPYGEEISVNGDCLKVVESCGYPCAVSNLPFSNHANKFFMPRYTLDNNKYLIHFELSGLKYFLKTKHLLPVVQH